MNLRLSAVSATALLIFASSPSRADELNNTGSFIVGYGVSNDTLSQQMDLPEAQLYYIDFWVTDRNAFLSPRFTFRLSFVSVPGDELVGSADFDLGGSVNSGFQRLTFDPPVTVPAGTYRIDYVSTSGGRGGTDGVGGAFQGYVSQRNGVDIELGGPASLPFILSFDPIYRCELISLGGETIEIDCGDDAPATLPTAICTASDDGEGSYVLECADGSSVVISDGSSCSAADDGEGTVTITCEDGSTASVSDGADGESCTVSADDGGATITCTDGTTATVLNGVDGEDGLDGLDGTSCGLVDDEGETFLVCDDGSSVIIRDGADGTSCSVTENEDGSASIACTDGTEATVNDGADGADGTSCTVTDNEDGTVTVGCEDGTTVTIADGTSCTVTDNEDGTATLSCEDGTTTIISDGAAGIDGTDGTSCTVTDNGELGVSIDCEDGTSATVVSGADGADGEDGANGENGADGQDGANGEDGANGTDGAPGEAGAPCSVEDIAGGARITCPDGTTVDVIAPESSGGCSTTGSSGNLAWPMLALLAVLRRRRHALA